MIVGVAGPYAAGKGEVVDYLAAHRFEAHSLSDVIRQELASQGLSETRERMIEAGRRLRERHGPQVLAERLAARFVAGRNYVIDSIRHSGEIAALRRHDPSFLLLWVDAPRELRFRRLRERGRPGDPVSEGDLGAFEAREARGDAPGGQQMEAIEAAADERIWNDGDLDALRRKVDRVLAQHPHRETSP